jgi:hypothetical protein
MGKNLKKWSCFLNIFLGIFVLIVWKHQMIGEIFDQPTKCSFPPVSHFCSNGGAADRNKVWKRKKNMIFIYILGTSDMLVDRDFI